MEYFAGNIGSATDWEIGSSRVFEPGLAGNALRFFCGDRIRFRGNLVVFTMPAQEDDYILRQIEILGRIIARLLGRRDPGEEEYALLQVFDLQEKLFGMPAVTFLQLSPSEQVAALARGQSEEIGRERCRSYATLLKDTADLYQLRNQSDLAFGARQLALYVALMAANGASDDPAAELVRVLRAQLAGMSLSLPIEGLLREFDQHGGRIAASWPRMEPSSGASGSDEPKNPAITPVSPMRTGPSYRYDAGAEVEKPIRPAHFMPVWKLALAFAAVVFAFIAYSCYVSIDRPIARTRGFVRLATTVYVAFGDSSKTVAPIAAGAAFVCTAVLLVTAKREER